jgi:ABC transporter substrate binding protein (PQQ-dependent alcohol dehydrogenase system)
MTERPAPKRAQALAALALAALGCLALAGAARAQPITIGYVELDADPRYRPMLGLERLVLATREHPFPAVEVALDEARPLARATGRTFATSRLSAPDAAGAAAAAVAALAERDVHFFILDLPADAVRAVAAAMKGRDALLFNATADEDSLRRQLCAAELVHTVPSQAMRNDALAQYLVSRKWRDVLLLQGPRPEDAVLAEAFIRSATKFGLRITEQRRFQLGNNPREREANNIGLLTATTRDYDVVFVADTDPNREFSRQLPYFTTRARPVVGSAGMEAEAWHWTYEHYGAPQLINRFIAKTGATSVVTPGVKVVALAGRHMTSQDWAAWIAARMIVRTATRLRDADTATLRAEILKDPGVDGVKGLPVSVRAWDNQLRQAMLLVTPQTVVASAPLPGFLHATNELDTLGDDAPETPCHLRGG